MISDTNNKISFPTKLFCFSLAFEPLMFFVLSDPHRTGLTITVSRILQVWAGVYFFAFVIKRGHIVPNPFFKYYKPYFNYIILGIFSSVLGIFFYGSYILTSNETNTENTLTIASFIRGTYSRPFFEILIAIYYFLYFVVAPKYVLKTKSEIKYLLDLIIGVFIISLLVGILDCIQFLITGINLIPRHLVDSSFIELGTRYHGFAGEPRDAFPYLVFGLATYFLRNLLFKPKELSKPLMILTVMALVLTQSTSGIIGVVFGILIYLVAEFKMDIVNITKLVLRMIFAVSLIIIIVTFTDRITGYIAATEGLYNQLKEASELHPLMAAQSANIYPLWKILINLNDFNLFPVLFGSGFGSVSFINKNLGDMREILVNPQSNAVRLLYEVGFLGLWFYLVSQIMLIRDISKNFLDKNGKFFYLLAILLVGICLGHRSTTIFILCGIALSIITSKSLTYRSF